VVTLYPPNPTRALEQGQAGPPGSTRASSRPGSPKSGWTPAPMAPSLASYRASTEEARQSKREARERLLAYQAPIHAYSQPVALSSSQAQQPQYQLGGEEPYQSRHYSRRTERQRARRIAHHRARQGREPDSDAELLEAFSEGFDRGLERQRNSAAYVTESPRSLSVAGAI
jgi:hypothetical protein